MAHGGKLGEIHSGGSLGTVPHGVQVEVELEKKSHWKNFYAKSVRVLDQSFRPDKYKWQVPDDLAKLEVEEKEYPWFMIRGKITEVYGLRDWDAGRRVGSGRYRVVLGFRRGGGLPRPSRVAVHHASGAASSSPTGLGIGKLSGWAYSLRDQMVS